ncbi:MAG: D-sedoheptulose 7-phosphate isomerase [Hyphomicrobiales bacterium]|jgi:D-sedoheptulose 7-phosphate isomerase|nr:D-sedoheptulose 7-phosphate isomerase [Hyphomicrobiales bacterium]
MATSYSDRVTRYLEVSRDAVSAALADRTFVEAVSRTAEIVTDALRTGKKILLAGNGGSAADAQHLATELMVRFYLDRAPLPALALTTDGVTLTATGNDLGFEHVFSRQVLALGQPGDVFLGLSTSGRSPNILAACKAARERGMTVIGFTGAKGEAMAGLCDLTVRVPSDKTPLIQQVHIAAGHIVCEIAEEALAKRA